MGLVLVCISIAAAIQSPIVDDGAPDFNAGLIHPPLRGDTVPSLAEEEEEGEAEDKNDLREEKEESKDKKIESLERKVAHAQSLLGKTEATGNEDEHEDALEEEETKEDENEQASLPGEDDAKEKKIEALTKK